MKTVKKRIAVILLAVMTAFTSLPAMAAEADGAKYVADIDTKLQLNHSSVILYYGKENNKPVGRGVTLRVYNNKTGAVSFSSSNKKVAAVSESGEVTPQGVGKCTIKVKVGKKTLKCTVNVKKMPADAELRKKITSSYKLQNGYLVITVKNKTDIPVGYTFVYKESMNNGSASDYKRKDCLVTPGAVKKFYCSVSENTTAIKKMGTMISFSGKTVRSGDSHYLSGYSLNYTKETKKVELHVDNVKVESGWGGKKLKYDYTVINNAPYNVIGNVYLAFYKKKKLVKIVEVTMSDIFYQSFSPGVTEKKATQDAVDFDSYKIFSNGFYIYEK